MKDESQLFLEKDLKGIGGWLLWVLIGLALSAISLSINLGSDVSNFGKDAAAGYSGPIEFEIFSDLALVILILWTARLILKRRRLAVRIMTLFLVASFLIAVMDSALIQGMVGTMSLDNSSNNQASIAQGRTLLMVLIWVPYFYRSRRVRATLTE